MCVCVPHYPVYSSSGPSDNFALGEECFVTLHQYIKRHAAHEVGEGGGGEAARDAGELVSSKEILGG